MTEQDQAVLKATVELVYAVGLHTPKACQIALAFTQLVEKLCKPQAVEAKDTPKEATGK